MRLFRHKDERGIAHIVEIVIIGVIVLGVAGFIVWRMMSAQPAAQTNNTSGNNQQQNASCNLDQDICKFLASWKQTSSLKVTSQMTINGETTASTYESTDGGKRYHMTMTISGAPYEVISIDGTTYTKAGDTWWKQTAKPPEGNDFSDFYSYDFSDVEDATVEESEKSSYEKVGTEACGSLQCFKYKVVDPASADQVQYIWFDTKDYQLRRMLLESPEGNSDQTFDYTNVTINEPSPVKDLAPNQYIIPGQSEPMTLPDPNDYNM